MPTDWKTDRDALVSEAMAFAASVKQHEPVSNLTAAVYCGVGNIEQPSPLAFIDRERAAIKQRVANFKALQQRLIREREAFATTVFQQVRPASDRMEYSQMLRAITTA